MLETTARPRKATLAPPLDTRYPIETQRVRSFQHLRWAPMPGELRPLREDGTPWHPDTVWRD